MALVWATFVGMKHIASIIIAIWLLVPFCTRAQVVVGAERSDVYLPMLEGKRIGLFTNHTGRVGEKHTLEHLLSLGLDVRVVFAPEHGFRGTADAGEHVGSTVDKATGIPVVSLFGTRRTPSQATLDSIDVIVTDIQDVGLRFYTYYITMTDLMRSAAGAGKEFVIFDRPNPLGMCLDGPVLDMRYASGVGRLPIPVLHGLTLGELAKMAVGEKWLRGTSNLKLQVVPCQGYTHATRYELPIAPSPNLPDMQSVYLYPSMCYFEATPMSLGRGTDFPFCVYGHPQLRGKKGCEFSFTPESRAGARKPPLMGRKCYGVDLRQVSADSAIAQGVNLEYIIDAVQKMGRGTELLTPFFEKLIGTDRVRKQIAQGLSAAEIKATWAKELEEFDARRQKYLIYPMQ